MNTVLSSIENFLTYYRERGVAPDLLGRWTRQMETQVLVSSAGGRPVEGTGGAYTDGQYTWWSIRVPKHADGEPEFNDYKLDWPLDLFADAIGCTGWDWVERKSRWVGFDFDDLTGHAAGVGVSTAELAAVRDKACALPWIEVRKSTGGSGLHLYVHLDVPTENHTVHAALARSVLGAMSAEAGFDFASRVDCLGGNMWIWRKNLLVPGADGLSLIKPATETFSPPASWRDHIEVVSKRRTSVALAGQDADAVESLARAKKNVPLEEDHKRLLTALEESGFRTIWNHDHHLLQTKTKALLDIFESQVVPVKGVFKTLSEGRNPHEPNCFMFPLEGGGWKVCRFGEGCVEADTWHQDGAGFTTCFYNRVPSLRTACLAFSGVEDHTTDEFVFYDADLATRALRAMGDNYTLPPQAVGREIRIGQAKNGHLTVSLSRAKEDERPLGFVEKKSKYTRVLATTAERFDDPTNGDYQFDDVLRRLETASGENAGWVIHASSGAWSEAAKDDVKDVLVHLGTPKAEVNNILGQAILQPWKLVNLPFQSEYPGGRQWNHQSAQLAFEPAESPGPHPTWDRVLAHAGHDLDEYIKKLEWCAHDGISTGADYLRAWAACMLREPFEPLPYLFFFGEQGTGKSTFHECLAKLMTRGVSQADRALSNKNDFNGELAGAVLCVVEERDIAKSPGAYNKIKEWVTGRTISIRRMRTDAYSQPNTTHWIQCANPMTACPVFPGDRRIIFIWVVPPAEQLPKQILEPRIVEEAPYFLRTLMDLALPRVRVESCGLRLPVITTDHKVKAAGLNANPLEAFLKEHVVIKDGAVLLFSDFYKRFEQVLDGEEQHVWSKKAISKNLPPQMHTDTLHGNKTYIINAAWKTQGTANA